MKIKQRIPKGRKGVLTRAVREKIHKATRLLAGGTPMEEIAKTLGVSARAVEYWRTGHRKLWNRDFRLAVQATVSKVRREAGTDRILADPDEYMRLALVADKWTAEREEELFPTGGVDMSVSGFYKAYYVRNCLGSAQPETYRQYEICLNLWRRITGDPPLRMVTNEVVGKFRDVLLGMRGRGGRPYSPNTVRSKMVQIQAILDAAGPPGPRHRDAAGILARIPWAKPPRQELDVPRIVSDAWLARVYQAASCMHTPDVFGIAPADWWRSLLAVALNTALRRGTLFALRWDYIDLEAKAIVIPHQVMKARRGHFIPLNETALEHLARIKGDREMVFPWPYCKESFQTNFKLLQGVAGIPKGERFGLHAIRRTAATLLWKNCPEAAQIILGHTSATITLRHYVHGKMIATEALNRMPQPWAREGGAL